MAATASAQKQLDHAIARAVRREEPVKGTVLLSPATGDVSLVATLHPIPWTCRMMAPAEAAAIVTLIDPTRRPVVECQTWSDAFGLTAREADLAHLLVEGYSLQSAAHIRQRSVATMRVQLRHIFEKTGVGRQPDLISLLARIT